MFALIRFIFKLAILPLYIPLYCLWALFGGLLGMKHNTFSVWRF